MCFVPYSLVRLQRYVVRVEAMKFLLIDRCAEIHEACVDYSLINKIIFYLNLDTNEEDEVKDCVSLNRMQRGVIMC